MQGDPKIIHHLQAQLRNELTATNQYFLHYRILQHWGFGKLAKKEYEESIGEMKHADKLIKRILFLDGLPNLQDLGKLMVGEDVPEAMQCDLRAERDAQATLRELVVDADPAAAFALGRLLAVEEAAEMADRGSFLDLWHSVRRAAHRAGAA